MSNKERRREKRQQKVRNILEDKYGGISRELIMVYLLDRLDEGTGRLNYLTIALVILTIVLGVLTAVLVAKAF